MKPDTLTALKESIEHWFENLIAAQLSKESNTPINECGFSMGGDKCALCNEFWDINCEGCPIFESEIKNNRLPGGTIIYSHPRQLCHSTPYEDITEYVDSNMNDEHDPADQHLINLVGEEINFLISLLPDNERKLYE